MLAAAISLTASGTALAAPGVSVYPSPGTRYAEPGSQISFRGVQALGIGTLTVVGSRSGVHTGSIQAHSDGQGGSFLPARPFTPGETVTVTTSLNVIGGNNGTFSFTVAVPAGAIQPMQLPMVPAGRNGIQHFRSRPDLLPASVTVTSRSARAAPGDMFVAPEAGPRQNGPMLLDPAGRLLWFYPVPHNQLAADFRVQNLDGQPVLTWWQGYQNNGSGRGVDVIFDRFYHRIAEVSAANGLQGADLHEFLVTPQGQAYIVAVFPVQWPGRKKPLVDSVVQEIDIKTGLVMFEWDALDHVPLSSSYFSFKSPGHVFDPFHINSVAFDRDGNPIVSMRNTWAVYKIDHQTGNLIWTLGSNRSSFKLGRGVAMAFQHNVVVQPDGTLTAFDDGAGPPVKHPQSRALRIALNTSTMTASLVREYDHSPPLLANFEGGAQLLPGGDLFVGYGQQPYFSEFDPAGHIDFDAHFTAPTDSYRAYRLPWNGLPSTSPAVAVSRGANGISTVYASWNGATAVVGWRVLAGTSPESLQPVADVPRRNFETAMPVHSEQPYFAVQALAASDRVLAISPSVGSGSTRLSIFGRDAFVRGGFGGISVGCFSSKPCSVAATISAGRTVVARTGREAIGAGTGGTVFFSLSPAGRSLLARARGHQLGVSVRLSGADRASTKADMTLVPYATRGRGPGTSFHRSASLSILGHTAFINHGGIGGLFVSCTASVACRTVTTVRSGGTVLATTGREFVGAQDLGNVFFKLSRAGQALLARNARNQLPVQVSVTAGRDVATAQIVLTRF